MKSYIQGIITGGALVFALFILIGTKSAKQDSDVGRYKFDNVAGTMFMFDTELGKVFIQPPIDEYDDKGVYRWTLSIAK